MSLSSAPNSASMAVTATAVSTQQRIADALPPELWTMVMKEIWPSYGSKHPSDIRLVCRNWNVWATPYIYRHLTLITNFTKAEMFGSDSNKAQQGVLSNILAHAVSFEIFQATRIVSWAVVIELLSRCIQLEFITYNFNKEDNETFPHDIQPFPKPLSNALITWERMIDLYLENRPVHLKKDITDIEALAPHIFSAQLNIAPNNVSLHTRFFNSASNLDELTLVVEGTLSGMESMKSEMPALETLAINSDDWRFYSASNLKAWDFTELETLTLTLSDIVLDDFLDNVTAEHFPCLYKFWVCLSGLTQSPIRSACCRRLSAFVGSLRGLKNLFLTEFERETLVSSLSKLGSCLEVLGVRDDAPAFSLPELYTIIEACPNIWDIKINTPYDERFLCIDALCCLENLVSTEITLYGARKRHVHETIELAEIDNREMARRARLNKKDSGFRPIRISQPYQRKVEDGEEVDPLHLWEADSVRYSEDLDLLARGMVVKKATSCFKVTGEDSVLEDSSQGVFDEGDYQIG